MLSAQTVDLASYYAAANGKKQAELKTALYHIIGNPDVMGYGSLWSGFYETDRLDDNQVIDRYSNDKRYFSGKSTTAVSGMNKEHGIPKSWWGGKSSTPAYSDLHHLMPSDSKANSAKSNYGMGIVTGYVNFDNGCIKVGRGDAGNSENVLLWEPADNWKGDFARAHFYIVTAYEELSMVQQQGAITMQTNTYPKLQPWAYKLYLEWSKQDPVDDLERKRNEAVYAIQGNRNPFIDYPTLAEYIWGDSTTVAFDVTKPHTWDGSGQTVDTIPNPEPIPADSTIVIEADFTQSLNNFSPLTVNGEDSQVWTQSSAYGAVANAYNKGKVADDWLVSPILDLSTMSGATLSFEHSTGYNGSNSASEMMEVLVTADVDAPIATAEWESLSVAWPPQRSNSFTAYASSGLVSLDEYARQKIVIAFHYRASEDKCWAWEIKNLSVKAQPSTTTIAPLQWQTTERPQAVFDMQGRPLGSKIPQQKGMYVVIGRNGVTKITVE